MQKNPDGEPLPEAALKDPRQLYDHMRAICPAAHSDGVVTLFRHADVIAAAKDFATFSSAVSAHRQVPNSLDPPEHDVFRAIVDRFFTPERMRALEPKVRQCARDIIAALPMHTVVDAVRQLGYPFAVHVQTRWLGWRGIEETLLAWMAENHAATRSGDPSRTAAVASAFDRITADQIERRRALGDAAACDPTTELMRTRVDGELLSDADIVSILRNWTAGDLGSIAAAIGVVAHFLATHREVQQALREDSSHLTLAIDEMLRMDDPFISNRRVVTAATDIAGARLDPGARVYLNWTSANRDEAVFGDPDAYQPAENAPHNLVYGIGPHICPGRPLATLELVAATQTLLQLTSSIELATEVEPERETWPVGGWRHVPVRLRAAIAR
ncbi:MAG: cytochrome P450 [Burkholderiaceae bacterium]|jgi:cytochrome P450|nr:cytochrome P450 [Burkholderiaceae bacterium]